MYATNVSFEANHLDSIPLSSALSLRYGLISATIRPIIWVL